MREPIRPDLIRAALVTSGRPWRAVEFHPSIGSTNSRAAEIVRSYAAGPGGDDSPLWRIVLTDDQTGGRGRLGRTWQVPPRASLAVSAVVPAPAELGWVPLLAGVALVRAITAVTASGGTPLQPRLKWPNDVLLPEDDDRKVAGILSEFAEWAGGSAVVIGTGVNVDQTRDELPVDTATSLRVAGAVVRREDLVTAYLDELAAVLQRGPAARSEYRSACATVGSHVRVHLPAGGVAEGRAVRVDDTGALVVSVAGGEQAFSAGDVVHVRPADGRGGPSGLA
ncbi:biotin--[acetyl-CoA-carboxylase] ligase [Intrasporangium calvum]|uniref:biotin--[biotin carboxyl-carrier protein] ligase n=1 Tax=Intrasporangium calvum TaxID=53358 RepID=A0ABT5GHT7_9MICO|nr:biotin--[acetyl-CoA-carboxylase] ligase [Intrasporangium calvum]MDC5697668.1 biotin--[acetyl-CoA-carboxylase] ligase [Intrasporangium calvum]